MRRFVKIGLTLALWAFVAGFVLYFGHRAEVHRSKTAVRELQIVIEDSLRDESLVTSALVRSWIARGKIATVGVPLDQVDLAGIEHVVRQKGFVRSVSAYVSYDGVLRVEVTQRRPALRLRVDGYDSYVTSDGFVFPAPALTAVYVPVITGSYTPPVPAQYVGYVEDYIASLVEKSEARIVEFQHEKVPLFEKEKEIADSVRAVRRMLIKKGIFESHDNFDERVARLRAHKADLRRKYRYAERENERRIDAVTARQEAERENQKKLYKRYEDFLKLINFVKYIEDDSFWRAEIVQIVAVTISNGDVEVELVPRTGDHTVLFGAIEDVEEKFDKLLAFYRNGLENIGWEEYRTISVKYKGQVVCRK